MSMANTRLRNRAQRQCGAGELASGSSTPCWRGVGVMDPRSLLWGAQHPPERPRCTRGSGTNAASFSNSSKGESLIPVVPSDHGWVKVSSRAPLASCASRSSDTAPLAVERMSRSNWSRRWAGIWVLACREKPCPLAQRGPVRVGLSPKEPKPEPRRRTCYPAPSPKAMRCCTEAAKVRASSGSSSRSGSYPVATIIVKHRTDLIA
jgi:hypothetical protein